MQYSEYFRMFNENDNEEVVQLVPNAEAEAFLLENAPRLYCPDPTIEETFAFRTWTIRKHLKATEDGCLMTEFLVGEQLKWAGKHNTINAPLTHHLNEYRWFKNADQLLDYIEFFLEGEGSADRSGTAFAYHTPALTAMVNYCRLTGNEQFLRDHAEAMERYFLRWDTTHRVGCGLYCSNDDREGTEVTISGNTPSGKRLYGLRPLMNACMYGDACALSEVFGLLGNEEKRARYHKQAEEIRGRVERILWDGDFFKAIHPYDQNFARELSISDIPEGCNARELMGYIPWTFGLPSAGKEAAFALLKDEKGFRGVTGLTTAEIAHERFMYRPNGCTWNGNVWPYATSYAIGAVIELLSHYEQQVLTDRDLYDLIHTYAEMHYSMEEGKRINFIDEVMSPFEPIWSRRAQAIAEGAWLPNRGRDYNHSTFIDLVLRGLCGIDPQSEALTLKPRISGIWSWFKLENLSFRGKTYTVYYDEDGSVFGKGAGVTLEKV